MDLTVNEKAVELLREAEAKMNDEGAHWTKGIYNDSHGRYCSMGAFFATRRSHEDDPLTEEALQTALRALANTIDLSDWRDRVSFLPTQEYGQSTWGEYVTGLYTMSAEEQDQAVASYDEPHDIIVRWNDSRESWDEVKAGFDAAIEKLSK